MTRDEAASVLLRIAHGLDVKQKELHELSMAYEQENLLMWVHVTGNMSMALTEYGKEFLKEWTNDQERSNTEPAN